MKHYLREKYGDDVEIVQYIGYCSDEEKRTSKQLYHSYDVSYPLVDADITTSDALNICYDYGFNFGRVYEHHSHYNCWLCPLQRVNELRWLFENDKQYWDILRDMQYNCDGYYSNHKTIFDYEKQFWEKHRKELEEQRLQQRKRKCEDKQ